MKSVILAFGTVLVLGCVEQPSSRSVSQPPPATVFDELAAAVEGAVEAKRVEEDRLGQYGVEKQRLVSRLMPLDVEWAVLHPLAVEDYVTERDVEAAKNLCVVLEKRDRRQKTGRELPTAKDGASRKTGSKVPKQDQESPNKTFQTAAITPGRGVAMAKSSEKNGRDSCVLSRGGSKFLSVISYQLSVPISISGKMGRKREKMAECARKRTHSKAPGGLQSWRTSLKIAMSADLWHRDMSATNE